MFNSNAKRVKTAVRRYILDHVDLCGYGLDEDLMDDAERIEALNEIFRGEKKYEIERVGISRAAEDWFRGLCPAVSIAFTYKETEALLHTWLGVKPGDYVWSIEESDNRYWRLLAREFVQMIQGYSVSGYARIEF